ncbi:MAG: tetratricopeptide repeat protein [Gammaproteobacteria bacterium]
MDEYLSEKEQIAVFREWWRDNGSYVIAGLILGVGLLVGWKYWQAYREARAEVASTLFTALLEAVENQRRDDAFEGSDLLIAEYGDTPYATQAALAMARLHIESQEPTDAADQLRWALDNTSDRELAHIARLRLARVLLDQGNTGDAGRLLEGIDGGEFAPRYHEVLGDTYLASGDDAAARKEYGLALANAAVGTGVIDRNFVQMKLDSIVETAPSAEDEEE